MPFAGCWSPDITAQDATLIVSEALIQHQDGVSLHPDLFAWEKQLSSYRRHWFDCGDKNPLGWYASLCETSPTLLLAQQCRDVPAGVAQCWMVSPYHAQLARTAVRVMPEGQFAWAAEDAAELCYILNPLLEEEGMQLCAVGAALFLACREAVDAYPQGFGSISGRLLPDRHHEGEDGGRLNRLLSEIQMFLFQNPLMARHERGEPEVSGIWLWAPVDAMALSRINAAHARQLAVATRNPVLRSIVEATDAACIISEPERLPELLQPDAPLPKRIVLAGDGYAVWLSRSMFPTFGSRAWQPKSVRDESSLLCKLRSSL